MKNKLKKAIENAVSGLKERYEVDFVVPEIEVDYPKNEAFGDYTTNVAMMLGKILKKNPMEVATEIVELLEGRIDDFDAPEIVKPGYINFTLGGGYLRQLVIEINESGKSFGSLENKERSMIEYSQPNTHKEFHVGHLRNVIIGNALVNTLRKCGQDVVAANYIGDTGTHVAKCLWGLVKFHDDVEWEQIENKTEFLGKVYSEAAQKIEENDEYKKEFKEVQKEFENGDSKLVELWEKTREWSLDDFNKIYDELGVRFDVFFYESEEEKEGKKMLPRLLETEIIRESEGAIIADLEKYGLGVLVLQRSDGAALYGLKDIPLAIKKFEKYNIEKSLYVIDVRQSLYFQQLFKILEEIGFRKEMVHIGYDFVTLSGGESMSSRKGNIVPARFLLDKVREGVSEKFPDSPNLDGISLGAIKFFMLKYSSRSKIEFDIEESIRLEGATGPYVQYAHARISSILGKAGDSETGTEKADLGLLVHEKELDLIRELNKFPELIEEVAKSYDVHKFPYYAIRIADKFHSFYNDCRVIDEENPELTAARLELAKAVKIVLGEVLGILGVSAPEKM